MDENQQIFVDKFFFYSPFIVPLIVTGLTYVVSPYIIHSFIWLPLIIIYWSTLWVLILVYQKRNGHIFSKERFKITLCLQGKYLIFQYIIVYAPLILNLIAFIQIYSKLLSINMLLAVIGASIMNGFSEEVYWRATLDEAGQVAGISEWKRLIYMPIVFALWHTAFVLHFFPMDSTWLMNWGQIMLMTWSSGLGWVFVLHRSKRIVPQIIAHICANFLYIFPWLTITVLNCSF
jgi:hypothetical protein